MGKRQRRRDREAKKQQLEALGRYMNTAFDFRYLDTVSTCTGRLPPRVQMQQFMTGTPGHGARVHSSILQKQAQLQALISANGTFTGTLWEEATVDQPKYTSHGMQGFTENGPSDDWDLALGTLRGYRWWKWVIPAHIAGYMTADQSFSDFSRIRGAHSLTWPDGQVEAVCDKGSQVSWDDLIKNIKKNHEVPEYRVACACGFWAYWSPGIGYDSIFGSHTPGPATLAQGTCTLEIPVFGSIRGSGRVILGEKGFRSQYGELEALCIPPNAVSMLSHWIPPEGGMTHLPEGFRDRGGDGGSAVMKALMQGNGGSSAGGSGSYTVSVGSGGGSGWTSVSPPRTYAVGGCGGSSYVDPHNYGRNGDLVKASDGEIRARLATLETALGDLYPSARIMSSQDLLTSVCPPEAEYNKAY